MFLFYDPRTLTSQILGNYEAQLSELHKEQAAAAKDFGEWHAATAPPNT